MNSAQRREQILKTLSKQKGKPISASALAKQFQVSRQIVVGDIALMRASNVDILATPRGYLLQEASPAGQVYTIACVHQREQLQEELYTVVDNGGGLLDVVVEHPLYGQLSGPLHVFSRYDADLFLEKLAEHQAAPLSALTGGAHLHRVICPDERTFQRIQERLREKGILLAQEAEPED